MKKFTFNAFLLMIVLSANVAIGGTGPGKNLVNVIPFYSENFSGGIPSGWQNNDSASTSAIWKYTTTGASDGKQLNATGTTAANGYVIFDSDEIFGTNGDAWLITNAIDCSTKSNVQLSFNEYYKQDQNCVGEVYISTDGINWGAAIYSADAGLANGGDATPNANAVNMDISATADGQATVYVAFHFLGNGGYYWMVDDLHFYEVASFDAGVTSISAPVTSCSLLSSTETVCAWVKNFGSTGLTNIPVSYVVDGNTPVVETITATIAAGDSLNYCFTQTADLSANGVHTIVVSTSYVGDVDNTNDLAQTATHNGPYSLPYTQGFETVIGALGWSVLDGNTDNVTWVPSGTLAHTGSVCLAFDNDLPAKDGDDWVFSPCISFTDLTYSYALSFWYTTFVPGSTDANLDVYLLSDQNPSSIIMKLDSFAAISNNPYINKASYFSVPSIGNYYFGWHATHTSNVATNTSVRIDDINVDFYVKTSELNSTGAAVIYPNPNNGTFSISNLKSFNGQVLVNVLDMMGRSVYTQTVNGLDKINMNLSDQAAGVYTVRVSNDSQVLNQLISITK